MSIFRGRIRPLLRYRHLGLNRHCNVCGFRIRRFVPLGEISDGKFIQPVEILGTLHNADNYETLNINEFLCPICGSQDKARLYALFLQQALRQPSLDGHQTRLLHVAPEGGLPGYIRKQFPNIEYLTLDLYRTDVDLQGDITDLAMLKSNSFDAIICSHVLEHIDQDRKAISELYRILRPGGWAIMMVPILLSIDETYEDSTLTSEEDRLRAFGLEDHVRMYSKADFVNRLVEEGFIVEELSKSHWPEVTFQTIGVTDSSVLYVAFARD